MAELQLLPSIILFLSGVIVGVVACLAFNKVKTGSASASALKKEKDQYQADVEAHFEETSKKFKTMASQYQDLYQHLSVGATTLCRPENIAPGLINKSGELGVELIEAKAAESKSPARQTNNNAATQNAFDSSSGDKTHSDDKAVEKAAKLAEGTTPVKGAKSESQIKPAVGSETKGQKPQINAKQKSNPEPSRPSQESQSVASSKSKQDDRQQPKK